MRLLSLHIISDDSCGGLLEGLKIQFRSPASTDPSFDPLCLIGPNGTGKSQVLQAVAEIFQSVFFEIVRGEERVAANPKLQFEIEYLIGLNAEDNPVHVRVSRKAEARRKPKLQVEELTGDGWIAWAIDTGRAAQLVPRKVVGYTSGNNETLSLPFLVSRRGYADQAGRQALKKETANANVPDTRLMLIDYGTHLEVLVANLLLGSEQQRTAILEEARLEDLHSFRCVVQLAHGAVPKRAAHRRENPNRKGVQLTAELQSYLEQMQRCATATHYEDRTETHTFDFRVGPEVRAAFNHYWHNAFHLYSAFHKLAMLNDLAIPKSARERFRRDTRSRRFASRLPEPQDEDKVFRFESVTFRARGANSTVDYVSLSDGEHQLAQILGTFAMVDFPDVLFLLDEPESHLNPQWRTRFVTKLHDVPTANGPRRSHTLAALQESLVTTHAPFIPSDTSRERMFIFSKSPETGSIGVRQPSIETYGATFDTILEECFDIRPPISAESKNEIAELAESSEPVEVRAGIERLGFSVEKVFLIDHLRQITKGSFQ